MGTTLPSAENYIIKRPRLTKLLDESTARIILLCAPAGYGKTTLAREWVATRKEPVAWYRGGIEMLDAAAVLRGISEALLRARMPQEQAERLIALASQITSPELLGRALASAIPEGTGPVVVIDDYHNAEPSADSESLIAAFATDSRARLLITSRARPRWMSARMFVYGDAISISAQELAFTEDEAREVLSIDSGARAADAVVNQARGWPAVIGLAARRKAGGLSETSGLLPAELYEYFAEDVFRKCADDLRRSLFKIALGGDVTRDVTEALLGNDCEAHLAEAATCGFVVRNTTDEFELHPLLRAFLLTRLRELPIAESEPLVSSTLEHLAAGRHWDECLAVLTNHRDPGRTTALLSEALPDLLESGRLTTVHRWIEAVGDQEDAVVLLAESELALREGLETRAQAVAERAAALATTQAVEAQAHLVAARAAHLRGDDEATRRNARKSAQLATIDEVRFAAAWVEFLSAFEVQDPGTRGLLEKLRQSGDASPEQALRLVQASLFLALELDCEVRVAAGHAALGHELLRHVADPLARSSFLNIAASTMVYLADYERALQFAEELIDDARLTGLDFAADHALIARVGAFIGLRKIAAADRVLQELEGRADATSGFVRGQIQLKRSRLKAVVGDLEHAEILLRAEPPRGLPRAAYGEWIGHQALYLAAQGDTSATYRAIEDARHLSTYIDARNLSDLAAVIAAINERADDDSRKSAIRTMQRLVTSGHLDGVVLACRVCHPLAAVCAKDPKLRGELTSVFALSRDVDLARAAGLSMPRELRRGEGLTQRERDVYELLIQGRKNREIARALFISESTTKVHIRHIFEKLGVHSRAEAATVAARYGIVRPERQRKPRP